MLHSRMIMLLLVLVLVLVLLLGDSVLQGDVQIALGEGGDVRALGIMANEDSLGRVRW